MNQVRHRAAPFFGKGRGRAVTIESLRAARSAPILDDTRLTVRRACSSGG